MRASFDVDRLEFDRCVFTCYFQSVVKNANNIHFTPELLDQKQLHDRIKKSTFEHSREYVYYGSADGNFMSFEVRLRKARSMTVYFNFNRYFNYVNNFVHDSDCPVLHDDNFLPLNSHILIQDYLRILKITAPKEISELYKQIYTELWGDEYLKDNEQPIVIPVILEVGREMYPLSVNDFKAMIPTGSIRFSSYNQQSQTMYFGEKPKISGAQTVRDKDVELTFNAHVWNLKEPYEKVRQAKLYQKSLDLARFEITLYHGQIRFENEEDLTILINHYLELFGLAFRPACLEIKDRFNRISIALKVPESVLIQLSADGFCWLSTNANRGMTKKLVSKQLIERLKRGTYKPTKMCKSLLACFENRDEIKAFVPKYL